MTKQSSLSMFVSHLPPTSAVSLSLSPSLACSCVACVEAASRKCAQQICAASLLPLTPSQCKYFSGPHRTHAHTPTSHSSAMQSVCVFVCAPVCVRVEGGLLVCLHKVHTQDSHIHLCKFFSVARIFQTIKHFILFHIGAATYSADCNGIIFALA